MACLFTLLLVSLPRPPQNWAAETMKDVAPFLAFFSGDELRMMATKVSLCSVWRRLRDSERERKGGWSEPIRLQTSTASQRAQIFLASSQTGQDSRKVAEF